MLGEDHIRKIVFGIAGGTLLAVVRFILCPIK